MAAFFLDFFEISFRIKLDSAIVKSLLNSVLLQDIYIKIFFLEREGKMGELKVAVRVIVGLALLLFGLGMHILADAVVLVRGKLVLGALIGIPAVLLMISGAWIIFHWDEVQGKVRMIRRLIEARG